VSHAAGAALVELELRRELRALRTRIPDEPQLNPILNVAFDLSRKLEAGQTSFADLKALAALLMDRAAARRAVRLRERVGLVDHPSTLKDFTEFVAGTLPPATDSAHGLEALKAR